MLIDKKDFWDVLTSLAANDLSKLAKTNLRIAKSELKIEKLLKSEKLDIGELADEYYYLSQERSAMAYIQGIQDGTKLLHTLLSGEAVNHMLKVDGVKADNENEVNYKKITGIL